MSIFSDLLGTTKAYFKLGLTGVRLKNDSGNLAVRNTGDSADAAITASKVNVSGDSIDINSDAAGSGADWKYSFQRPASGMTVAVTLTLPVDDGTPGQILQTDGSGVLSWTSAGGSTAACVKIDTTTLAFGDSSPVTMFSTSAADIIERIQVIVDTAFNGTSPTVTVGVAGTTSKYSASTDIDLKTAGVYEINPGQTAQGLEALIVTYVASGSSAGAARILVYYATPS
jgi:hypothetical protein